MNLLLSCIFTAGQENRRMKTKDSKLLSLIAIKDEDAFDVFYDRYIKMIYKSVYHELGSQEQTDDLIQDFWAKVWENPSFLKCDATGSVRAYMLQYLKFRVLDLYRKTLTRLLRETAPGEVEQEMEEYNNTMAELSEQELLAIIREALEQQPTIVRNAFWMRINNWSVKETAHALSVSPKTIYNKYSESLTVVRRHIREHYPEFAELKESR